MEKLGITPNCRKCEYYKNISMCSAIGNKSTHIVYNSKECIDIYNEQIRNNKEK